MNKIKGFSLVELMVAMVISLVLIGGAFSMFMQTTSSSNEVQEQARVQETLRLAVETIAADLRMAGFTGCSKDTVVSNILHPDKLAASEDLFNISNPIEGWDADSKRWKPSDTNSLSTSIVAATDALTIRYIEVDQNVTVETQMPNTTNPVKIASSLSGQFQNGDVIAITDCAETNIFGISNTVNNGNIAHGVGSTLNSTNRLTKAFGPGAFIMRPVFKRYFIGLDNGVPSLFVTAISSGTSVASNVLARGIERMEFRYGQDSNNDNIPDSYVEAKDVTDWNRVIAVRYALLGRTDADPNANISGPNSIAIINDTYTPPSDTRIRKVIENTVTIRNRSI